jgi:hypothetical protein
MPDESTSHELEELFQHHIDAVLSRDYDAVIAFYAPDAVWDTSSMGIGVFEGHSAIRAFYKDWRGAYADFDAKLEEFRDLGNGVTFAVLVQHARPEGSIGFVEFRYAAVRTWTDTLVQRDTLYTDIDEGRAAAERLAEERR